MGEQLSHSEEYKEEGIPLDPEERKARLVSEEELFAELDDQVENKLSDEPNIAQLKREMQAEGLEYKTLEEKALAKTPDEQKIELVYEHALKDFQRVGSYFDQAPSSQTSELFISAYGSLRNDFDQAKREYLDGRLQSEAYQKEMDRVCNALMKIEEKFTQK